MVPTPRRPRSGVAFERKIYGRPIRPPTRDVALARSRPGGTGTLPRADGAGGGRTTGPAGPVARATRSRVSGVEHPRPVAQQDDAATPPARRNRATLARNVPHPLARVRRLPDSTADAPTPDTVPTYTATEYETTATGRRVHPEFRETVLGRYGDRCPVSGVDYVGLLDVAHVLPWSEFADLRADFENVLALDRTHHAAFDRGLFTFDSEYRLRLNPAFETNSDVLRRTLADRDGEEIRFGDGTGPSPEYLRRRNERLDWSPT
ncbi:HNH endonuclease [Halorussus salinisoli]|uniref:HNH endonuclease n=1 Tax=Halorussus salinisoli TaxID=2558242 RepID=UPI0010C1661C|nr:HNH endonuclease signature motif containing protein [Halorussus salinisoli]